MVKIDNNVRDRLFTHIYRVLVRSHLGGTTAELKKWDESERKFER